MTPSLICFPTKRTLRMSVVAKGAKWNDVKALDVNELLELNTALKAEHVMNPEEVIQRTLKSIMDKKAWHKLVEIRGAMDFIARFDKFDFDSCETEDEEVLSQILERIVAKKVAKLQERSGRLEVRASNRSMYLPQLTLVHELTKDGMKRRWRFETDLISTGILPRMLEAMGHKTEGEPLSLRIVNNLPLLKDENGKLTNVQEPIPEAEWAVLRQHGWLPTAGNLAWNWKNEALRKVLVNTFPKAIHMGAYNHRLNAPLIPGGYLENVSIRFNNPVAWDSEPKDVREATLAAMDEIRGESTLFERDQECDGAGLYNPNHPRMAELVQRYGKVVFQITMLRPDGLFGKGVIVPREGLDDDVSIQLDMAQVKGAWKEKVAEGQWEHGVFIGLMKSWDRISYFPGSFELLEFIRTPIDNTEVQDALGSLIEDAVNEVAKDGIDGLMAEIAKDDEHLKLVVKIIAQIRAHGMNLNPMSIPMVKSAIEDKLRAKLWLIAQGAGIRGRQYVTILDATVPQGTCVLAGFKKGSKVAIWRFPCVLPQGLVTCEVSEARPHHMIDDKVIPNTVFLNPRDLTARMQGDDDGDIVGISNDPRLLLLFAHKATERVYLIEPKGQKFDTLTDSEKGFKYLETDPRGPVGRTTIWQAQLLACGDWWGAVAMGVLNQEAIDAAKNCIEWTDVAKACINTMWIPNEQENLVLSPEAKLSREHYGSDPNQPEGWPGEYAKDWVAMRLQKFGCIQNKKIRMEPLAWRIQHHVVDGVEVKLKKRISPQHMVPCTMKSKGFTKGNLVHWCHDKMIEVWRRQEDKWAEMFEESSLPVEIRDLLFTLLEQKGRKTELVAYNWSDYLALRKTAGIVEYGAEFKKLLHKRDSEDDVKFGAIEALNQTLHLALRQLSAAELATVWYWELTPTYSVKQSYSEPEFVHEKPEEGHKVNRENYAFRAISFPGSPILPLLGIEDVRGCSWLLGENRGTKMTSWLLTQELPFRKLSERAFANTSHGDMVTDEQGHRVEFQQCQHCMEHLTTSTIRGWRAGKTHGEKEYMRRLTTDLNKIEREGWSEEYVPLELCMSEYGELQ